MFTAFDVPTLLDCLGRIPPVELQGLELLRQFQPQTGVYFPQLPAEAVCDATIELIDYTQSCQQTVRKLQALPPTPLLVYPVLEFCL
ncbi:MAG: hypothetical protein IT324_06860 [Anaerolineae bacterium]|nr:hypothetical protein [Anaerolineae bacterium]